MRVFLVSSGEDNDRADGFTGDDAVNDQVPFASVL
jgi:hypothetical protein